MFGKIKFQLTDIILTRKVCIAIMACMASIVIFFTSTFSVNAMKPTENGLQNIGVLNDTYTNLPKSVGGKVTTESAVVVYVTMDGQTITVFVNQGDTVEDAINLSGFTIDEHDSVNLPLTNKIVNTEYIDIINIEYLTTTYSAPIPHGTKKVYSKKSDKIVTTPGKDGVKEVTSVIKLVNGQKTEEQVLSEKVLEKAKDEIVTVGIKNGTTSDNINSISKLKPESPIQLDKNGNPVKYKKHITVQATAYTYTGNNCAWGVAPKPGYVAINTDIFPYGTKFYIKSSDGQYIYGYAVAADTGGFVKTRPTNFDLFFSTKSECIKFGRRNIEVYVLD